MASQNILFYERMREPFTPVSFQEALDCIAEQISPILPVEMSPDDAYGLCLARPVLAPNAYPEYDLSLMDGYSVRTQDTPGCLTLTDSDPLEEGQTHRARTGMPLSLGADAVVLQENVTLDPQTPQQIRVPKVMPQDYIRKQGSLFAKGDPLVQAGKQLRAEHVAMILLAGVEKVFVYPPFRIAIAGVGDELKPPGEARKKGDIVDVSKHLAGWLGRHASIDVWHGGIIPDSPEHLVRFLQQAKEQNVHMILTMGGSGRGPTDHSGALLAEAERCLFRRVALQPGMPTQLGIVDECPLFILPGRVLSAFMITETLVRAAVQARMGNPLRSLPAFQGTMACSSPVRNRSRDTLVLVEITKMPKPLIEPLSSHLQRSDTLLGLTKAGGYILQKAGVALSKGQNVEYFAI